MKKRWLKDWPWDTVVTINAGLCKEKNALHKPTSDGYTPAHDLWESSRKRELTLREVLDVCRQCHKLAPFCFYNCNTFAALYKSYFKNAASESARLSERGGALHRWYRRRG
jgi:hypothetical protein